MIYKTNWLRGLLGPMMVSYAAIASAVPANIAANGIHTAFIDNGAVFSMGYNKYGEVAPATGIEHWSPYFTGITNAKSVAVNFHRTAVLRKDGSIVMQGIEWVYKQPYQQTLNVNATDVALTMKDTFYVSGGTLFRVIDGQLPQAVPGGTNVKHVAAGNGHVVILFNDGTVGTFGNNWYGQIGNGTIGTAAEAFTVQRLQLTDIVEVAAGDYVSAARNSAGEIFVFGRNDRGYLGLGHMNNQTTPAKIAGIVGAKKVAVNQSATAYIAADDTLRMVGWHNYIYGSLYNVNTYFVRMPIGAVYDVALGIDYTMVDRGFDGKIEGWGGNGNGKLGDNSNLEKHQLTTAFFTPVPAPVEPVTQPVVEPAPVVSEPVVQEQSPTTVDAVVSDPVPVTQPTDTTSGSIVDTIVDTVTEVIDTVVEAITEVIDTVVEVIVPTPVEVPVVTGKCNNGWGNGDQCAPGKSLNHNNAENAVAKKGNGK